MIESSPSLISTRPVREAVKRGRIFEIALPDGVRISLDAEVDEEALREEGSAMIESAPSVHIYLACHPGGCVGLQRSGGGHRKSLAGRPLFALGLRLS
jgi:hypothetical protein